MNFKIALSLLLASAQASYGKTSPFQDEEVSLKSYQGRLLQDSSCTLFRKCVTYKHTEDHPNGRDEHSWACKLSSNDEDTAKTLPAQFVDIVESPWVAAALENATSGASVLTVSEAVVSTGNEKSENKPQMYIPEGSHLVVSGTDGSVHGKGAKRGPQTTGELTTLVIRVTDGDNKTPDASVKQLEDKVFGDVASMKKQNEACSYGKLKIKPFQGKPPNKKQKITNGVVDVKMDYVMSSLEGRYYIAAEEAAMKQLGDLEDSMFDLVMFCFPPSDESFVAWAWVNSKYSYYNDNCQRVQISMHEIGHNIGLAHSGEAGNEYGDTTGVMGSSNPNDKRCYNPQKNYQLGWYEDQAETINPLVGADRRKFTLNGVSDYMKNDNALIVLRLEQLDKVQDYYIGFNRAKGIHQGTFEDKNMVTIVRKESGGPNVYGKSQKLASLEPGEKYVIKDFNGQMRDVEIEFLGLDENGDDATIEVTAVGNDDDCKDEKKKRERFQRKEGGVKKTCKFYAKKKKCDKMIETGMDNGKYVWEVCKKSCDRCDA